MSIFKNRPTLEKAKAQYETLKKLAETMDPEGNYSGIGGKQAERYQKLFGDFDNSLSAKVRWYTASSQIVKRAEKLKHLGSDRGEYHLLKNYYIIADIKKRLMPPVKALKSGVRLNDFPFLEEHKIDVNDFYGFSRHGHIEIEGFIHAKISSGSLKWVDAYKILGLGDDKRSGDRQLEIFDDAYQVLCDLRHVRHIAAKKINLDKDEWVSVVRRFVEKGADFHIAKLNKVHPSHPVAADVLSVIKLADKYLKAVPPQPKPPEGSGNSPSSQVPVLH